MENKAGSSTAMNPMSFQWLYLNEDLKKQPNKTQNPFDKMYFLLCYLISIVYTTTDAALDSYMTYIVVVVWKLPMPSPFPNSPD